MFIVEINKENYYYTTEEKALKAIEKLGNIVYHKRSHIAGILESMLTDEFAIVRIPSQDNEHQAWHIDNITIMQSDAGGV